MPQVAGNKSVTFHSKKFSNILKNIAYTFLRNA